MGMIVYENIKLQLCPFNITNWILSVYLKWRGSLSLFYMEKYDFRIKLKNKKKKKEYRVRKYYFNI